MTPEEVAAHTFPRVRRGYSDNAVREFLARVSQELLDSRAREVDLARQIEEIEAAPADPTTLSRDQLVAALGAEAEALLEQRARSAQLHMAEARTRAEQEVRAELEAARARGREILVEAQAARDRVVADFESQCEELEARRDRLQAEIGVLEQGRDRLLDVYRRVRQAVGVVESVEAEPMPSPETPPAPAPEAEKSPAPEPPPPPRAEPERRSPPAPPVAADDNVHNLFTRLESEVQRPRRKPKKAGPAPAAPTSDAPETRAAAVVAVPPPPVPADEVGDVAGEEKREQEESVRSEEAGEEAVPEGPVDPAIAQRDEVLEPVAVSLARQAKRAVQDEQNALLDALRRRRAATDPLAVVPALDEHAAAWSEILRPALDRAYGTAYLAEAPAKAPGSRLPPEGAPVALVAELAHAVVLPLRERVIDAIRQAPDADALAQRVAARYREYRGQYLEPALEEALAIAYARGIYDGAPEGSILRWVPNQIGQCPDADDNALEPTRRGGRFPTGQQYPPAHPGCRCALAVINDHDDTRSRAKPRATTA